jgi:hypothetical protein
MIRRLGSIASRVFYHICPDPFVIAILLTILTAILALTFGEIPTERPDQAQATKLLDAWRSNEGLWKFLSFGMQMCLILVTGHALAAAPRVRRLIDTLAGLPKTPAGAVGLVAVSACATGILNWGLGLIVGAFMAREVGRNARFRKKCQDDFCASGGRDDGSSAAAEFSFRSRGSNRRYEHPFSQPHDWQSLFRTEFRSLKRSERDSAGMRREFLPPFLLRPSCRQPPRLLR